VHQSSVRSPWHAVRAEGTANLFMSTWGYRRNAVFLKRRPDVLPAHAEMSLFYSRVRGGRRTRQWTGFCEGLAHTTSTELVTPAMRPTLGRSSNESLGHDRTDLLAAPGCKSGRQVQLAYCEAINAPNNYLIVLRRCAVNSPNLLRFREVKPPRGLMRGGKNLWVIYGRDGLRREGAKLSARIFGQ